MIQKEKLKQNTPCHSERALATEESMDPSHSLRMTEERGRSNPSLSSLGSAREPQATPLGGPEVRGMSVSEQSMWRGLNASHYAQSAQCGRSNPSLSSLGSARGSMWRGLNLSHYAQSAQCGHISFLRHAELVSASQAGRSMVEMLGVLAVIGILSVAGVKGYSNAMNKHRANELLNEASKRAAIVAMQAAAGRFPLSIEEFGAENAKLGFNGTVGHDTTNKQFTLSIGGVSAEVCTQIKNSLGPTVRKFAPATCTDNATVELTYNDDMSTTAKASDFNGDPDHCPGKYCTATDTCVESGADCTCSGTAPACKKCNTDTGNYVEDSTKDDTPCDYTTAGANDGVCKEGVCEQQSIEGKTCYKADNSECGGTNSAYYCAFASSNLSCTADSSNALKPSTGSGTCESIDSYRGATITGVNTNSAGHIYNRKYMDWWSANAWCIAKGSTGLYDAGCGYKLDGTAYSSTECSWSHVSSAVSGMGRGYFWLKNLKGNNSCTAFGVNLYAGSVDDTSLRPDVGYAMCE